LDNVPGDDDALWEVQENSVATEAGRGAASVDRTGSRSTPSRQCRLAVREANKSQPCPGPGARETSRWSQDWTETFPGIPCPFDTTKSLKKLIRQILPGGIGGRGSLQRLRGTILAHFLPDAIKAGRKDGELFRYFSGLGSEPQFRFLADLAGAGFFGDPPVVPVPVGPVSSSWRITPTQVQKLISRSGLTLQQGLKLALDKEFPVSSR
jgi:hypothetical protein